MQGARNPFRPSTRSTRPTGKRAYLISPLFARIRPARRSGPKPTPKAQCAGSRAVESTASRAPGTPLLGCRRRRPMPPENDAPRRPAAGCRTLETRDGLSSQWLGLLCGGDGSVVVLDSCPVVRSGSGAGVGMCPVFMVTVDFCAGISPSVQRRRALNWAGLPCLRWAAVLVASSFHNLVGQAVWI
jgi:hypothetical protein